MEVQEHKRAREDYKEIEDAFIHGPTCEKKSSLSDRPWKPHTCLMKLTCAGVRKEGWRGGNGGVGVNHVVLFSEVKGPWAGWNRQSMVIGSEGEMDLKLIVSVGGFRKVSGLTGEGCACKCVTCQDQWSMLCNMVAVFCHSVCQSAIW